VEDTQERESLISRRATERKPKAAQPTNQPTRIKRGSSPHPLISVMGMRGTLIHLITRHTSHITRHTNQTTNDSYLRFVFPCGMSTDFYDVQQPQGEFLKHV
jgi:hypothetical protein